MTVRVVRAADKGERRQKRASLREDMVAWTEEVFEIFTRSDYAMGSGQ